MNPILRWTKTVETDYRWLESGKKKLILLDEILKGTNSKDKQAGSIALIEQLLHYKSVDYLQLMILCWENLHPDFPDK